MSPGVCFVPSSFFFKYIDEINCNNAVLKLIKYADDIAFIACLNDELSLPRYYQYVEMLYPGLTTVFLSSLSRKYRRCALDVVMPRVHRILFLNH